MKPLIYFLIFSAFVFSSTGANAQTDTVKNDNPVIDEKYDNSYKEYIKQKDSEPSKLWKINFTGLQVPVFSLGMESKISRSFSSEWSIQLGIPFRDGFYSPFIKWSVNHSLKYYYNLNRKERLGRSTNGFNANYFSIDLFAGETRDPKAGYNHHIAKDAESCFGLALKYGMQKRFGIFYIEPYVGLSYQYYVLHETMDNIPLFTFDMPGNPQRWHLQPVAAIKAGIALESLFGQKGLFRSNICYRKDTLREHNLVMKTSLVDLGLFKPNIAFEWRITGNLTSETFLKIGAELKPYRFADESGFGPELTIEMLIDQQFRYYHNLKRRELLNRNTHSFSGNYLSLDLFAGKSYLGYDRDIESSNNHWREQLDLYRYGFGLKYGIQRRFGSIGYFDLHTGVVLQAYEELDNAFDHASMITTNWKILPAIGLRAGLLIGSGNRKKMF